MCAKYHRAACPKRIRRAVCLSAAGDRGWQARTAPTETDCVAGHVRLELRNVVANYPFERSHRFPVIQPNSGRRDYSRSSCDGGRRSLRTRSSGTDTRPETFVVTFAIKT